MKECVSGIGGDGNDFEGKPDSGSGAAELDVPKRCEGCPYVGGVTANILQMSVWKRPRQRSVKLMK